MTLVELDKELHDLWMSKSVEERLYTCGQLYDAEKAVLERLAPQKYSSVELKEFVFLSRTRLQSAGRCPAGLLQRCGQD